MEEREKIKQVLQQRNRHCTLEIMDVDSGTRNPLKTFDKVIEAPNWTRDGKYLIYNCEGRMYEYCLKTGASRKIDTGSAVNCNNDHVLSPDGSQLAVSHFSDDDFVSRIYILPRDGGTPRLVTQNGPSYLHGWSPDGARLSFCGERNGVYNIFTVPVDGRTETQLTDGARLDDGPEYSPCGNYIWFNSARTGLMQVWKMNVDGSNPVQMTDNPVNSWFPHVSPQGDRVVYLTYGKGEVAPEEHLPDKQVDLRIMDIRGGSSRILAGFRGGQGTINVNSWSPDGKRIAFIRY
ncbi:MAG: transporter [Treponema sp.]|jgi:Tol biopolymer transport system component|nr:transporter [Treponema sp.]